MRPRARSPTRRPTPSRARAFASELKKTKNTHRSVVAVARARRPRRRVVHRRAPFDAVARARRVRRTVRERASRRMRSQTVAGEKAREITSRIRGLCSPLRADEGRRTARRSNASMDASMRGGTSCYYIGRSRRGGGGGEVDQGRPRGVARGARFDRAPERGGVELRVQPLDHLLVTLE